MVHRKIMPMLGSLSFFCSSSSFFPSFFSSSSGSYFLDGGVVVTVATGDGLGGELDSGLMAGAVVVVEFVVVGFDDVLSE